jgi:hypothetical protein
MKVILSKKLKSGNDNMSFEFKICQKKIYCQKCIFIQGRVSYLS